MNFSEPLTKDTLRQLRQAEYIGFARSPISGAYIVATKGDDQHRIEVPDKVTALGGRILDDVAYCSRSIETQGVGYGRMWRSVAAFLKPGDRLALDWRQDGELHGERLSPVIERLSLIIERKDQRFEFIFGGDAALCGAVF